MALSVPDVVVRSTCRGCGAAELADVLELRPTPVWRHPPVRPREVGEQTELVPVVLALCNQCELVQLRYALRPDRNVVDNLLADGTRPGRAEHLESLAAVVDRLWLPYDGTVVALGANDGTFLDLLRARRPDARLVGIEPSVELAALATGRGHEIVTGSFDEELASELARRHGPADVVVAPDVLGHVDDLQDGLWAAFKVLAQDGVVVVETPGLGEVVESVGVPAINHGTLSYFSLTALLGVFERIHLRCLVADRVVDRPGTLRSVFCGPSSSHRQSEGAGDRIEELLADEYLLALNDPRTFDRLGERVEALAATTSTLFRDLAAATRPLLGFGAGPGATSFVHQVGLTGLIDAVADPNELVQDRFLPGSDIPVIPLHTLPSRRDRYCVLFEGDDPAAAMRLLRSSGFEGQPVLPCPEPRFPGGF